MNKRTVSEVHVWQSEKEGSNYFKVHVLGVALTVSEKKQPKSYQKIKEWYESDEPESDPILFSAEELAQ